MVELTGENVKATEITELLLTRYNLFIKDLSSKISRDDRQFYGSPSGMKRKMMCW